jgi:hypothetical protein
MKKQVLTFGLLAGAIIGGMTAVMVPLCMNGTASFDNAEVFGYTIQVLAFLLVFFGVRSYRDNVAGGTITFGKAFQVGILATLVACAVYVVSWEIVYYNFIPDFGDKYAAHVLERMKSKGESAQAIAKTAQEMAKFKEMYKNPLFNAGMTFLEVFPVGLLMTLVSAAVLRRKTPRVPPSAAAVAS